MRDTAILNMVNSVSTENIKADIETLAGFGTRHTFSDTASNLRGIGAARRWVKAKFEDFAKNSDSRLKVTYDPFEVEPDGKRIPGKALLKNVLAVLKGTDTSDNRIFIVSGHLDSRATNVMDDSSNAPGADDDASGVAVVLELTRIMSRHKFPSTIIFAAVCGEEQGLFGSGHLAEKAKNNNWNVIAVLNNDMVGNSLSGGTLLKDNIQLRVFSEGVPLYETDEMTKIRKYTSGENDSKSRELARYIKETGEEYVDQVNVKLIYRIDRFLRGGDHISFNKFGFPAVRLCEMNENYKHQHQDVRIENGIQYGDLSEFVDYEYVRKIAAVNLAALANLALAPAEPQNVGIDTRGLTNFSKLEWQPPKGDSPAGYYILIRETDQAFWQKKIFVNDTTAVLPYSKDNYFFAVQSVDETGHTSLPAFPYPIR
ncbi:MAG: M20/M25/M40 family metallo-hydrolase [Ignavibacteriaceae bacterium]